MCFSLSLSVLLCNLFYFTEMKALARNPGNAPDPVAQSSIRTRECGVPGASTARLPENIAIPAMKRSWSFS